MNWLDRLERRCGRFAIPGRMRVIVIGMALVFCCELLFPQALLSYYLYFDPALILQGQVWRVFTFVFLPPNSSPLFIFFSLYLYYFFGVSLENEWGSFRFTLYYLIGMIGTIIAGFLSGGATNTYLNYSLFFAFATLFPNMQLLLFFILPIRIKWLALFSGALFVIQFIQGSWQDRAVIIAALINYLIFFAPSVFRRLRDNLRYRKQREEWRRQWRN